MLYFGHFFYLLDNNEKMIISYVVISIMMCICTSVSSIELQNTCDFNYNYKCALNVNTYNTIYNDQPKLCTSEYIPKEVFFHIMSDEKNSSSQGVIYVNFQPPNLRCIYKVVLFVNSNIDNAEDCKNYQFNKDNYAEIHTLEKSICFSNKNKTKNDLRETETVHDESSSCKENLLSLWYEYIYTGCYALGFKTDDNYIFIGKEFLKTEYKKVEVTDPKLRCTYKSTSKEKESNFEMVTITADISLLAGSLGLKLELAPASLLHKNEENACNRYIENPIVMLSLGMSLDNVTDIADKNCSLTTTSLSTGDVAKTIECNFIILNSPKDVGYCFLIRILDDRCHKHTSWKPSLKDNVPCAWTLNCIKTEQRKAANIEEIKRIDDIKMLKVPRILYLVLFVAILLVVLAVLSTIVIAYRIHTQRTKNSLNSKIKTIFDEDVNAALELDGSMALQEKLVKESKIVILYVRESDQFMTFMSEFRKSLKQHTGCDVYDWWAPEMWNDVARLGGYEWVVKMIRKDCRIVWMDTLKARTLFATQYKTNYDKFKLKHAWYSQEISDFRDSVFPSIVDFAKRNNQNLGQEYQRHFVVRLETFENADKTEDPFIDLSPHARFLVPCHLDKLCLQLSVRELYFENEMKIEKDHLRKYLLQESAQTL